MTLLVASALFALVLPLAVQLARAAPSRLFAAAAIGFALGSAAEYWVAMSDTVVARALLADGTGRAFLGLAGLLTIAPALQWLRRER